MSTPPAESVPPSEHGAFLSGYNADRIFFSYFRCASCRLLYCPVYYSEHQLGALYGHQAENMAEVPLGARERTQRHYADLASPESAPEGDYLELGADIGLFAVECLSRRKFRHLSLYEPNDAVRNELDARLAGVSHTIHRRPFSRGDVPPGTVAVAAGIHVLDHVWEPLPLLRGLHAALKPGGRIFIVTHDERSLLARVLGRRWPPFTLQHPQLFSAASLTAMLSQAGFRQVATRKTMNFFPAFHLGRAALQVLKLPAVLPRAQGPLLGLRLGNLAAIATK